MLDRQALNYVFETVGVNGLPHALCSCWGDWILIRYVLVLGCPPHTHRETL